MTYLKAVVPTTTEEGVFPGALACVHIVSPCTWWRWYLPFVAFPVHMAPRLVSFHHFKAAVPGAASVPSVPQDSPRIFRVKRAAVVGSQARIQTGLATPAELPPWNGYGYSLPSGGFIHKTESSWHHLSCCWCWYKYCWGCTAMLCCYFFFLLWSPKTHFSGGGKNNNNKKLSNV